MYILYHCDNIVYHVFIIENHYSLIIYSLYSITIQLFYHSDNIFQWFIYNDHS
jgi:hypothetical protein